MTRLNVTTEEAVDSLNAAGLLIVDIDALRAVLNQIPLDVIATDEAIHGALDGPVENPRAEDMTNAFAWGLECGRRIEKLAAEAAKIVADGWFEDERLWRVTYEEYRALVEHIIPGVKHVVAEVCAIAGLTPRES